MDVPGSSPLARGLPERVHREHDARGIIPARAGFTALLALVLMTRTDHPRSRGVYPIIDETPRAIRGSSPLARGLLKPFSAVGWTVGIIPARAGFTATA